MGSEMPGVNVAIVVGSNRRQSINRQLAGALAKLGDGKMTARIVQIDDLPLYNQDFEDPLPASVSRFKDEIARADGVLFVTPEHNRSIPAVLKNAIDWGSRPYGKNVWTGKPAAITGTSPGAIASAIAQQHLRQVLGQPGHDRVGRRGLHHLQAGADRRRGRRLRPGHASVSAIIR